jgi:hypothetical protein
MKYRRALPRLLWLPVFLLLSFTAQAQDDELATIEFEGLQQTYCVGDTVVADLVEIVPPSRTKKIDLWFAVKMPTGALIFITSTPFSVQKPFKTAVEPTETSHNLLEFEVPSYFGGDYTLYALYVESGKDPLADGIGKVGRSNLAFQTVTLTDSNDQPPCQKNYLIGKFEPILNAQPNTEYTSNTVTIDSSKYPIAAKVSGGEATLIKNGAETGSHTITVAEGDTLAIKARSSSSGAVTFTFILTVGSQSTNWSLTTKPDDNGQDDNGQNDNGQDDGSQDNGEPEYYSVPEPNSTLEFGSSTVGTLVTLSINIANTGNADLRIDSHTITGINAADFSVLTSFPFSIASGDTAQTVTVQCKPSTQGIHYASLQMSGNDGTQLYNLQCTGENKGEAEYSSFPEQESTLLFGKSIVGTPITQKISITNNGDVTLEIGHFSITGTHSEDFKVLTSGLTIAAGVPNQMVEVQCTPSDEGLRTANLQIGSNDKNSRSINYGLECEGQLQLLYDPLNEEDNYNIAGSPGNGYDSSKNRLKPAICLNGEIQSRSDGGEGNISSSQETSYSQLSNSLTDGSNKGLDGAISIFGIKIGGGHSKQEQFLSSITDTQLSQTFVYRFYAPSPDQEFIIDQQQTLTPIGEQVSKNACQFVNTCGDQFIYRVKRGVRLYVTLTFIFQSVEHKKFFSKNTANFLGLSVSEDVLCFSPCSNSSDLLSVSANWSKMNGSLSSEVAKTGSLKITVMQKGGNVVALPTIIGSKGGLSCQLNSLGPCKKAIEGIIAYTKKPVFRNGIKNNPATFDHIYRSYEEVGISVRGLGKVPPNIKMARDQLAEHEEAVKKAFTKVQSLLQLTLNPSRQEELAKIEAALSNDLKRLEEAERFCFCDLTNSCVDKTNEVINSLTSYDEQTLEIGIDDGLVGYYPLDGNPDDASGLGNHGTERDGLSYSENGYIGQAAEFNNKSSIVVPDVTDLRSSRSLTFSAWVNIADNNDPNPILALEDKYRNPFILLNKPPQTNKKGRLAFRIRNVNQNGQGNTLVALVNSIQTGENMIYQWLHVAGVVDYENSQVSLFLNGRLERMAEINKPFKTSVTDRLLIGTVNVPGNHSRFNGYIDEVRIYNRALSLAEIEMLYDLK